MEVIFFDLFFTLITPKYDEEKNEYDIVGMTKEEWEKYAEDSELYYKRATGQVSGAYEIIEDIANKLPINISKEVINKILHLRQARMAKAIKNVDSKVITVLSSLKKLGYKLCLISNADMIDVAYWQESELSTYFDEVVFSYEVGFLKPDSKIYEFACKKMRANPSECFFVGDGGSDEIKAAKSFGMHTIFTEYFVKKSSERRKDIMEFSDYHVDDFREIIRIIETR